VEPLICLNHFLHLLRQFISVEEIIEFKFHDTSSLCELVAFLHRLVLQRGQNLAPSLTDVLASCLGFIEGLTLVIETF